MGLSDQAGNELDEFVTNTLRNNLLGLPLDLATINMARARSRGHPPAERPAPADLRRDQRRPADAVHDWVDFGEHLKHPESLVNFVAAYGQHPSITARRRPSPASGEAARLIVDPDGHRRPSHASAADESAHMPADAADFMGSTGAWANAGGRPPPASTTSTCGSAASPRAPTCSAACSAPRSTTCSRTSSPTCRTATGSTTWPAPRA